MTVLFYDDFSASTLDLNKWQPNWYGHSSTDVTKPVNGAERAAYDPKCVSIRNGKLHLHLRHTKVRANNGVTYAESTGCITTLRSFATPNTGYKVSVRVFLPGTATALYNWPAVWLDGLGTWPNDGENDILEGLGGKASYHYHSPSGGPGGSVTMGTGWHLVESEVASGIASYFYDGHQVGQEKAIERPQFLIIGNQSGSYGGTDVPDDMRVDTVDVSTL